MKSRRLIVMILFLGVLLLPFHSIVNASYFFLELSKSYPLASPVTHFTWDGSNLWIMQTYDGSVINLDMTTGEVLNYFKPIIPSSYAKLGWDGTSILIGDSFGINRYSTEGVLTAIFAYPIEYKFQVINFAWDDNTTGGPYIWLLTSVNKILQTKPGMTLQVINTYEFSRTGFYPIDITWNGQYLYILASTSNYSSYPITGYAPGWIWRVDPSNGLILDEYKFPKLVDGRVVDIEWADDLDNGPAILGLEEFRSLLHKITIPNDPAKQIYFPSMLKGDKSYPITATPTPTRSPTPTRFSDFDQ